MRFLLLLCFAAALAIAQAPEDNDWTKVTSFPALSTNGLSPGHKAALLRLLREENCNCGCNMKIAECRIKDPACRDSRTLAAIAAAEIKAGKDAAQVRALLHNGEFVKARRDAILAEPVELNVAGAPSLGPATAAITIVEFSDFLCPYCRTAAKNVVQVLGMFPKDVRLVFKQFPLDESHAQAMLAAQASLAAHAQGKFWQLHDKMFTEPRAISKDKVTAWAHEIGLDVNRFTQEITSGKYRNQINKEKMEGVVAGVSGTPTFFINGRQYQGEMQPELLKPVIEAELKKGSR